MNLSSKLDPELEQRLAALLRDVLIRLGMLVALVLLCYRFFSPFLTLMIWALILAVTLYPVQKAVAGRVGGRQGLAATLIVILGFLLVVVPSAVIANSLHDSMSRVIQDLQTNSLAIPAPSDAVAKWPVVGPKLHSLWSQAHADLPALIQSMQPQTRDLAKSVLGFAAGVGRGLLTFFAAFIIAGIIIAFGEAGDRAGRAIFERIFGRARGADLANLSTQTVRAVALGVIGVAFIQALIIGVCLVVAGVPWAGVLALIAFVFAIVQVPVLIVTLPAVVYIWWSGDYSNVAAVAYTLLLAVAGIADNVLRPLMLGRGVEAPMAVILLGALGGMVTAGILGMFVGATVLTLGYQVFMHWVATNPEAPAPRQESDTAAPGRTGEAVPK